MAEGNLKIHSENILPIIKRWLYSDKEIFIRELVSNSSDALQKLKWLAVDGPMEVHLDLNVEEKTVTISDTGIGMTHEEVETYIAQIAFSGAEEFVKKYNNNHEMEQFIGHFGLGFYSSFMVSHLVEIDTLSYKEGSKSVHWKSTGSSTYEMGEGKRTTRGTTITLHIAEDSKEFLDIHKLKELLVKYCAFLPFPVFLRGEKINTQEPLWLKKPSDCTREEYLEFYNFLHPMQEEPLFWIHLNVDYPYNLKGILYFPKIGHDYDSQKKQIQLYCNRVFVTDNCKEILPSYLTILKGIIDSKDIPLNVSRSALQLDKTVKSIGTHISKKVSDSLTSLFENEKERFLEVYQDLEAIIKIGAMEDEKFYERVQDLLLFKTIENGWMTAKSYLDKFGSLTENRVFYAQEGTHGKIHQLYLAKGIDLLVKGSYLDVYLIPFLEKKLSPVKFQRIDGAIHSTILNENGSSESSELADLFRSKLGGHEVKIEVKSLASKEIPALLIIDEDKRRLRDYFRAVDKNQAKAFSGGSTLLINSNSPLVNMVSTLETKEPALANALAQQIYKLSLLSQKEMEQEELEGFVDSTHSLLYELAKGK